MSKVTFHYVMPEERHDVEVAFAAPRLYSALWEISQKIRTQRKYAHGLEWDTAFSEEEKIQWIEQMTRLVNEISSETYEALALVDE
jgi:hypothetical protein